MRVKRILCIVLSLAAVFSLAMIRDSVAWINTQSGTPLGQNISAKKLNFTFAGTLGSDLLDPTGNEYIVPGRNLINSNGGAITATNSSTIKTEIRFKVIYHKPVSSGGSIGRETVVYAEDSNGNPASGQHLTVTKGTGFTFDSTDNYFYSGEIAAVSSETLITLISSIAYNDAAVTMELYNPKINGVRVPFQGYVKVIVQAKQKDHVGWNDVGGITWTTDAALPAIT